MVLGGPLPQGIVPRRIAGLARISCARLGELITSHANNLGLRTSHLNLFERPCWVQRRLHCTVPELEMGDSPPKSRYSPNR
jgi:hypothetical protein